jgi:hypothetical protein
MSIEGGTLIRRVAGTAGLSGLVRESHLETGTSDPHILVNESSGPNRDPAR